jgi:hypothetical protein
LGLQPPSRTNRKQTDREAGQRRGFRDFNKDVVDQTEEQCRSIRIRRSVRIDVELIEKDVGAAGAVERGCIDGCDE